MRPLNTHHGEGETDAVSIRAQVAWRLPGTTWRATTSTVIDETLSNALLSMRMPRRVSFDRSGEATVALNTDEPAKSTPEVAERPSSR